MKSSYKLLNIYLDNKQILNFDNLSFNISDTINIDCIFIPYNLFDNPFCIRKVSGSYLLSFNDFNSLKDLIIKLRWCDCIIIELDFVSNINALNILYLKRILQICNILRNEFKQIKFEIGTKSTLIEFYKTLLHDIYFEN